MTATVTSTGADAALSVIDPSSTATGRLVNGTYALTSPLQVSADGGAFAPLRTDNGPLALAAWNTPITNRDVQLGFKQSIGADRGPAHGQLRQDADVHAVDDARRNPDIGGEENRSIRLKSSQHVTTRVSALPVGRTAAEGAPHERRRLQLARRTTSRNTHEGRARRFRAAYLIHGDDHGRIAERRARLRAMAETAAGTARRRGLRGRRVHAGRRSPAR